MLQCNGRLCFHGAVTSERPTRFRWTIQPGEGALAGLASLWFFLLLASFYLLRPLRETFGIAQGADRLPWLMMGTLGAMALANPLYAWSASRWPRRTFAPWTYRVLLAMLLVFWAAWRLKLPGLGPVFFVWLSVFNLFIVAVFWSVLADLFADAQGRRLFGLVSLGGTLGAMVGAAITERLVGHRGLHPSHLLLLSALVLAVLPIVLVGGFAALALHPAFATLAVVIILERGLHYGLDRPSREVLYIPLGPEEKYKSKAFIDTFVYRAGDVLGVWLPTGLAAIGIGAAPAAGVLSVLWLACAGWLGKLRKDLRPDHS